MFLSKKVCVLLMMPNDFEILFLIYNMRSQGSHRNLIMNFHDFSMTICHFSMTFDHQLNSFVTMPF